jgi:hypothetical protein
MEASFLQSVLSQDYVEAHEPIEKIDFWNGIVTP